MKFVLQCKYCDYLNVLRRTKESWGKNIFVCEFTDFVFVGEIDSFDFEHPCKNVSFETHLTKKNNEKQVSKLKGNDWKLLYKKVQPNTISNNDNEWVRMSV